jgi:hypothetical protein
MRVRDRLLRGGNSGRQSKIMGNNARPIFLSYQAINALTVPSRR